MDQLLHLPRITPPSTHPFPVYRLRQNMFPALRESLALHVGFPLLPVFREPYLPTVALPIPYFLHVFSFSGPEHVTVIEHVFFLLWSNSATGSSSPTVRLIRSSNSKRERVTSVEDRLLYRDPYTVNSDGNHVGHDGFVVPLNFTEFIERFPTTVRDHLRGKMKGANEADIEDRVSEVYIHMMSLPPNSKFRKPGCNGRLEGCSDRIETFDPLKTGGANKARFEKWLKNMIDRACGSLHKRAQSNPIRRYNALSLYCPDSEGAIVDDTYLACHMDRPPEVDVVESLNTSLLVSKFTHFVAEHNPELVPFIEAIKHCHNYLDAQRHLGVTDKTFTRARNRLIYLRKHFHSGSEPLRQRRIYPPKVPRTATAPSTILHAKNNQKYASV